MARGRPSKYTTALAERICERISEGRSLRSVCRDADILVGPATVCGWVLDNDAFAEQYARASMLKAEARFDELIDIADRMENAEPAKVNSLRAKADVLKWVLSKMLPHKFSDKVAVEHQGEQMVRVLVEYADDKTPT